MSEDRDTEQLRAEQLAREMKERESARSTSAEDEAAQHARRADKARYLRGKLDERAESEREAAETEDDR
jgi:hypothetical protein